MSKEILVALNRKRGSVKAQLTRIKDFVNSPDEKDKTKLESKMDTLKSLRMKLSDIRNEYYEVVVKDSDLEPLELEILDLEDDCEDIHVRIKNIVPKIDLKNNDITSCGNSFNNIQLPRFNGSYHDWFNFKEQFISLIDSNNSLTDSQKLYYLKSTLTGIAKDVITFDDSYTSLFECLKKSSSHRVALCKSSRNCYNCSKRHNSLLCRNFERNFYSQRSQICETLPTLEPKNTTTLNVNSECFKPKQTIPYVESFDNEGEEFVEHAKGASTVMLSTAIVYCQNNRGELLPLRTLLDCGRMCNLISQDAVLALGLQSERVNISICGINGTSQTMKNQGVCRGFE
ncbi:integrase catalytic domain-containing protein [Trichonephila clavata]|uniref:Integrase catalytic domain-containing protein n=1 Tax=Trichonephila clavata TaxID=2740835 RepID=A0A8X6HXE9_TRICU|nr:integrase catalytic domain-containing protein [Trichonephila clavata]